MTWRFLGIRLDPSAAERFVQNVGGAAEDVVQIVENDPLKAAAAIAIAVVLPQVVAAAGAEILAATEVVSGLDFVASVDAINSVTGLTGAAASGLVGQAAFTAASTGGDLSQSLQTVLTNATGVYVDSTITDAFDSKLAGSVVRAATLASLNDKDVGQAVGLQLVPAGVGAAVGAITSGSTMDDTLFPTDEFAFGYDPNVDIFQNYVPTTGDVIVSPGDLGVAGEVTIDETAVAAAGVDPSAVLVSDNGELVDVSGQTVAYTAETFANGINVDDKGNILGPDNRVIITKAEADAILAANDAACAAPAGSWKTVAGLGAVCLSPTQAIANEIQRRVASQAGQTVIPGAGSSVRPAGTPPPNPNGVKLPEAVGWAAAAETITRSAANVLSIIKQVENGTYRPGAVSPYGTVRPPVVGVPVRQADGSTVVNNGNGTQTITYPNGTKTTMSTSITPAGAFGGVSTNTLLLVGAGLAAALLLRRK
jgi:hypothetical protein